MFGLVQFTFRLFADLEAKFTSVERLDHFAKTLKSEGKFVTDDVKMIERWPKNGNIEFDNVSVNYICFNFINSANVQIMITYETFSLMIFVFAG